MSTENRRRNSRLTKLITTENIRKAIEEPQKVVSFLKYKIVQYLYYRDFRELGISKEELVHYDRAMEQLESEFRGMEGKNQGKSYTPGTISKKDAAYLNSLILKDGGSTVVETGVCNGVSSLSILEASSESGGSLYSIDLPKTPNTDGGKFDDAKSEAVIPSRRQPGWIIPDELRDRWQLILGNSMYELPKLLRELEQIDVFVHDSEHSYEMMMFEFCLSWKHLKQGGYIVCDDHDWNDAFHDFAKAKGLTKYRVGNLGVVKKP